MFVTTSLDKIKAKSENHLPTLSNLKQFLLTKKFEKEARFVCFEDCTRCSLLLDGTTKRKFSDFFDSPPKLYRYDVTFGIEQIDPDLFFDENGVQQQVCFSYRIYKNGIGDQILVEYKGSVYDYSDYFEDVKRYDSIEAAKQHKESMLQKVLL